MHARCMVSTGSRAGGCRWGSGARRSPRPEIPLFLVRNGNSWHHLSIGAPVRSSPRPDACFAKGANAARSALRAPQPAKQRASAIFPLTGPALPVDRKEREIDMQISVSGKNMDTGAAFQTHAEDALNGVVNKYFDRAVSGHVTLEKADAGFRVKTRVALSLIHI